MVWRRKGKQNSCTLSTLATFEYEQNDRKVKGSIFTDLLLFLRMFIFSQKSKGFSKASLCKENNHFLSFQSVKTKLMIC